MGIEVLPATADPAVAVTVELTRLGVAAVVVKGAHALLAAPVMLAPNQNEPTAEYFTPVGAHCPDELVEPDVTARVPPDAAVVQVDSV